MRKGVWTQEEEAFALKLMEEFKEGRLPDISPKCTIRKLLEKKLHCAGMRISKKFGGQCFGKVPYKNYTKLNTTNAVTDMDELKKLEIDYLVSINAYFLPGDNSDLNNFCTGTTNSTTGSTASTQSLSNDFFSSEQDNINDQHPIFRRRTLFNPFIHLFADEIPPRASSSIVHLDQPIRAYSNGYPHAQVMRYLNLFREDNEETFDDRHYNFDKEELLTMNT
eukprot:gene30564-39827_t